MCFFQMVANTEFHTTLKTTRPGTEICLHIFCLVTEHGLFSQYSIFHYDTVPHLCVFLKHLTDIGHVVELGS